MFDRTSPGEKIESGHEANRVAEDQPIVIERAPGEPVVDIQAQPQTEPSGPDEITPLKRGRAPYHLIWLKLRRNRAAMAGLYILIILYAMAVFAGFLSPYRYDNQESDHSFAPPMLSRLHIFDEQGRLTRPFVYRMYSTDAVMKTYVEDRSVKYPIRFFTSGDSYRILWVIKSNIHLFGVDAPGRFYLFGADRFGQDVLSRILYGAQISLSIGIVGIIISTVIGMLIGGVAGYFGGVIDFLLMRLVEALLALPSLYFILIMRQMFGTGIGSTDIYLIIVIILAFIGWATEARVIRGMVLALKEQEYVIAARALGYSNTRIIVRHILPNTLSFVIVTATLTVPYYILGEVALSFLGVGIQEPEASWGNMLNAAIDSRVFQDFPWMLISGLFIFIAVMAWNFLGDGLRDATDPRTLS